MSRSGWLRIAAGSAVAIGLVILGIVLRPIVLPERDEVPLPLLNAVEVGFAQDMAQHHGQALAIVERLAPDVDPAVSQLGRQISDSQRVEIGTMLGWLRLANEPPVSPRPMSWMHHHSAGPGGPMPGMASIDELNTLGERRGLEAEILFLQLMLRHHEGGVEMAKAVDEIVDRGPVKESARAMLQEQTTEIGVIGLMLAQRGAQPIA